MDHNCISNGCKGKEFHGISLTCQNCYKPYFLECLKNQHEVTELIKSFGINNIPDTHTANTMSYKVKKLFEPASVFEFVCVSCKAKGNRMQFAHLKNQIDTLNQQFQT